MCDPKSEETWERTGAVMARGWCGSVLWEAETSRTVASTLLPIQRQASPMLSAAHGDPTRASRLPRGSTRELSLPLNLLAHPRPPPHSPAAPRAVVQPVLQAVDMSTAQSAPTALVSDYRHSKHSYQHQTPLYTLHSSAPAHSPANRTFLLHITANIETGHPRPFAGSSKHTQHHSCFAHL